MSSDLTYRLVVDLSTQGSLAPALDKIGAKTASLDGAFGKIKGTLGGLADGIEKVGDKIAGVVTMAATLGAGAAFAGITYGVMGLNNQLEQTKLSLGAIFSAQGAAGNVRDGIRLAGDVVKDMRKDAAQLPGEFKDLLSFMRLGATPGLQAGASVKDLEKLSAQAMAAAAATGIPMEQAAREFGMLLQGRAGAHNIFGTMLGLTGDKAEAFRQQTGGERLKTLSTELGKYQEAIGAYGESFDALSSTMIDNGKQILQKATAPLFDRVKAQIAVANRWFDAHEAEVFAFAEKVGERLGAAFEFARDKIVEWYPAVRTFATNAYTEIVSIWERIEPIIERVGGKVHDALANPDTIKSLEKAASLYGGIKVARLASPLLSGAGNLLGGLGGGIEIGAAAGPLAIGLLAAAGAVHVLSDETNVFHGIAMGAADDIRGRLGETLEHLSATTERLEPIVVRVADAFGTTLLVSLETSVTMLEKAAGWFDTVTGAIGKGLDAIDQKVNYYTGLTFHSLNPDSNNVPVEREFSPMSLHAMNSLAKDLENAGGPKTKTGAGGGGGGTHIQKVEIVVSSNQDPSRIARLTVDEIKRLSRFPTASRSATNYSASRAR